MNHVFRTVYNCALGVWQVASELVTAPGGRDSGGVCTESSGGVTATLRPLSLGLWLALGWVGLVAPALADQERQRQVVGLAPAQGRILSDPEAPGDQRPTVVSAPNGVPLVNITTPSEAGVSRNLYSQFDVGSDGAILNNSRADTQTQLGGWVQGNPWLATGTAKVILNEVNSAAPSRLYGYIEVAGDRAEVVIANPAGIQVNGGGFINTPHVTLTTGRPVLSGGALDHYRVERGTIRVEGAGLDTSRVDYTDIIARALEVHGGIWANELRATLGPNRVDADHGEVTATRESAAGGAGPEFALDVGALGGMYANKIWLVGNEQGLGARNAGNIGAQAGSLVVTVDGRLENTGTLQSKSDAEISAGGGLANAGTLSAARELTLSTTEDIDNRGGTLNARRLALSADSLLNRDGAIEQTGTQELALDTDALSNRDGGRMGLSQPLTGGGNTEKGGDTGSTPDHNPDPENSTDPGSGDTGDNPTQPPNTTPLADGVIEIAGTLDNDGGRVSAGGAMDLSVAGGLDNEGGHLGVRHLAQEGGDLHNRDGELIVTDTARIDAGEVTNDGGRLSFRDSLTFEADHFSNRGGALGHSGISDTALHVTGTLDNSDGTLETNAAALTIDSHTLVNEQGQITHAGTDGLTLQADNFSGAAGTIATAGEVQLDFGSADHRGATLNATRITLDAGDFDNRGGTLAASGEQTNTLTVAASLNNGTQDGQGGNLVSNGDLQIQAGTFGNAGGGVRHAGTGSLQIGTASLEGADGTIASNGSLTITGDTIDLSGGTTSAERIAIDSGKLTTADGRLIATGEEALQLKVTGTLNNDSGTLASNGAFDLTAAALSNRAGTLQAAGLDPSQIQVSGNFDNSEGNFIAAGDTTIAAAELLNAGGNLQAAGESSLQLTIEGPLDNSLAGLIGAGGDMQLTTDSLDNSAGRIEHAGTGELQVDAVTLEGPGGSIISNGALTITGDNTNLRGGTTSAQQIVIETGDLTTAEGSLIATGEEVLQLEVTGILNNDGGTLAGNGALDLSTGELSNREGSLQAAGADPSQIRVSGSFDNSEGSLVTNGDTRIGAGDLINTGGGLQTAGDSDFQLTIENLLDNSLAGLIAGGGELQLAAITFDNNQGRIEHAGTGNLEIEIATLEGGNGTILSNGKLSLNGDSIDLSGGATSAAQIAIEAGDLSTAEGSLIATGEEVLHLTVTGTLNNDGGLLAGNGALDLGAGELSNRAGILQTAGADPSQVQVSGSFDNSEGSFIAAGDTSIGAGELLNTGGSLQVAGESSLKLTVAGLLDNSLAGLIAAGGEVQLTAATLDNSSGRIEHAGSGGLQIDTVTLEGADGTIVSNGALTITGESTNLRGATTSANKVVIETGDLTTAEGSLVAAGEETLQLKATGTLNNDGGILASNGAFALSAGELSNREGSLQAAGVDPSQVQVSGRFDNSAGGFIAAGDTTINAAQLLNTGGSLEIAGESSLELIIEDLLDNSLGGLIAAGGEVQLTAATLDNSEGRIEHAGGGSLQIDVASLQGPGGTIASNGSLEITGDTIDLSGGATSAERIAVGTGDLTTAEGSLIATGEEALQLTVTVTLNNDQGTLATNGAFELSAGKLSNREGTLQAAGLDPSQIQVSGSFDNSDGILIAAGDTGIVVRDLVNTGGSLQVAGEFGLQLTTEGLLDNSLAGLIAAGGELQVAATTFDNSEGTVNASDTLDIAAQNLDNSAGTLVSKDEFTLRADILNNGDQGILASAESSVDLSVAGHTDNRGGTIQAALDLTLASFGLNNAGGSILGGNTDIDTQREDLENSGGTIAATNGALDIQSGALNNDGGLLQSAGDLRLDTAGQKLVNTNAGENGGLVSGGSMTLTSGDLDNRAGLVHAGGDITAHSDLLDNRSGGRFGGSGDVILRAAELHNSGGVLLSGGDLDIRLTGAADNNAGLISAGDTLTLSAASIDNRNTQGETLLGLQGDSVDLSAHQTDNRDGLIAADTRIDITGSRFDNTRGQVSSAGALNLSIDVVTNTLGTLFSGEEQNIVAGSLSGDGRILSQGDLSLTLEQDFINTGEVTANRKADISSSGKLTNESTIQAGDLYLSATDIDNTASGEISGGGTELTTTDTLTNRGLIDGGETRIDAGTLDNLGSGRIYGDHIAIQADTLHNREETVDGDTQSAVIAARQRLDLAAHTLINREEALIFSAGGGTNALNIGGGLDENDHASGRADFVHNASATIESLGGLTIDTTHLLNSNEHFATEEVQIAGSTGIVYIQPKGYSDKYTESELFELGWTYTGWKGVGAYYDLLGKRVEDWDEYQVIRTEYKTRVTESAPAVIRSGGDMTLRGDELINDKSQILAGGALRGDLRNMENRDARGEHRVHERGTVRHTWVKLTGWDDDHKRKWSDPAVYAPGDEVITIDLGVARTEQNQNGNGSGYQIDGRSTGTADQGAGRDTADGSVDSRAVEAIVAQITETFAPQSEQSLDIEETAGAPAREGHTATAASGPDRREGQAAGETTGVSTREDEEVATSTGPQSTQGTTTEQADGAAPTEIRTVGADTTTPQNSLFRLQPENGDYLIETDPRFANYRDWLSSDYLLDALEYDQDLTHKRLGDGFYEQTLVREQIALLTGRRFLDDCSNDEEQYRALLAAGATYANAWNLRPGVALTAEQMAQLTSDIVWLVEEIVTLPDGSTTTALVPQVYVRARPGDLDGKGTLISGESVHFDMAQDLTNTGTIAGRTAVKLTGENLRNLDGRITGDRVSLHARTDLDNIGGTIDAVDDLAVSASRDLNIATTTRSDSNRVGLSDYSRTDIDRVAGLYVSKGNLVATAGRDFTLQAAEIANNGDGVTQISAGRDLTLSTVETHNQENIVGVDDYHLKQGHTEEIGSSIRGQGQLILSSGRDTSLRAAEVSAGGDIGMISGGDLLIESATNTRNYDFYHEEEAGSSLSSDKTTATQHYTEEVVGSRITAGGGVAMAAEGDLAVLGSQVDAEEDIALDGRDITVAASAREENHYHSSSKSGPLGSESAGEASEQLQLAAAELRSANGDISLDAARNITIAASNLKTDSGDINLTAVDDLLIAAGEVLETSSSWSEDSGYFTGGDFYASEQRAGTTETTRAQGSSISAGNNLNIDSGRATVIGSDLDAGNDLNIKTDIGDIEILAARETSHTTYNEEEKRVGFGDVAESLSNPNELVKSEDGQLKIKLADAEYHALDSESTEVSHKGSNLTAGNTIELDAIGDLTVEGSNLIADTDDSGEGDINLAGENVIIKEAKDSLQTKSKETEGSAELSVVVQHQAVEVAKAVKALDEATENLKQAKEDYRKYEKDLKNLKNTLNQLEADYENGAPGVTQADIIELKQIIDDAESDETWYQAGIAAAALDVTSKTTALVQQTAAAAQSTGTYGFNAGVQLDIDATRTETESQQTSSVASHLDGQNISIKTDGGTEGETIGNTQIRGSHLQAENRIAIDTGDLDIEASVDTASSHTQTEHGDLSVQQTVYGAASGPSVSGSMDRSQSRDRQTTYNNSTLSADQIALNSSGDTTLAGANVHADSQLDVNIAGDLTVESQQNRANGSNTSVGISGGFSMGGAEGAGGDNQNFVTAAKTLGQSNGQVASVNGGANSSNGRYRTKETVLTSLTSGGEANIQVGEHTQITSALVATLDEDGNDLGNLNLSTETLDYADLSNTEYSSQQSAGISTSVGFTGSNPADPAQQNAPDASGNDDLRLNTSNVQYSNESHYDKNKTLATLGQGNLTVRDEESSADLGRLNRDVAATEKELFSVDRQEGNIDATLDHRLLNKEGRAEISQQMDEFGGNIQTIAQDIPAPEGGNIIENLVGETLNKLGELTLGITPSDANYGGLIAQVPVLFGNKDTQAGAIQLRTADDEFVLSNPDAFMPASDLPYYDDLDPDGQAKLEGLVVSTNFMEINPDSATYQNHTNGIRNNLPQALINAMEQTESEKATSHYNPTHGAAPDLMESLIDKVFGNGVIQTGVASQTGEFVRDVVTARPEQGSNFVGHSQGAALMNAGLNTLDKSDFEGVNNKDGKDPTFFINGAPVQAGTMEDSVDRLDFKFSGSSANPDDPVAEFLGRNSGDYIPDQGIGSADPISVTESLLSGVQNLPKVFGDKYAEYDDNGNQKNKLSPHSTYDCKINCGDRDSEKKDKEKEE